jgi:SAM-dependent methyltransferase
VGDDSGQFSQTDLPMSRYDTFASHYDHVVGSRADVAQYLRTLVLKYHKRANTLLELGCGSGSMLKLLSQHYACDGIDLSQSMLRIARSKAPKARLHRGDICSFNLKRRFDVVLCPFDTINHVTSFAKWKRVFARAHQHLNPGGVFIFDVNTEYKLECYAEEPSLTENTERFVSLIEVRRKRRYNYEIVLKRFERQKGCIFKLNTMILPELVVPTEQVLKALGTYFTTVTMVDPDRRRPNGFTDDLFFVCRGPR